MERSGIAGRIALLRPLVAAFEAKQHEIVSWITQEMGKPRTQATEEVAWAFHYFNDFLKDGPQYIADEITYQEGNTLHKIVYEPRGVVASIVPWNYPFSNFVGAVIPHLIVGNTVLFKHSEECCLLGKLIDDIMMQSNLPTGVFSSVFGDGKTGEMLVSQHIDMIWFTGSTQVGHHLYEIAAKKQIKVLLEMGGSNPALVFADVNIDHIIPQIVEGRFHNAGQSCDAIKRLLVHTSVYEAVVEKLARAVNAIKVGSPALPNTQMGPLAAMRQLTLLESQVADAIRKGAQIRAGGQRPEGLSGAYYSPTLLVNIRPDMRVWKEEVFGPVLPIVPFKTEEEALELANDTIYGLCANVYTRDLQRAKRLSQHIDAGSININDGNRWQSCNPFGGYKSSGMGCTYGKLGFQELCQFKLIAES